MKKTNSSSEAVFKFDGWVNALTNLGVLGKDKKMATLATPVFLDMDTLGALYQANSIAARIIDIPVEEMSRQGFKVVCEKLDTQDLIDFHKELDSLGVEEAFEEAYKQARLYGGAGILIGANDGQDPSQPLDLDKLRSVDYLKVLDRHELIYDPSGGITKNPNSANFGRPELFTLAVDGRSIDVSTNIHHSRIIRFSGSSLGRRLERKYFHYWGDSVLTRCFYPLRNYGISNDAIPNIIQDFNKLVMKMQDLPEILAMGAEGDSLLAQRLSLLSTTSSLVNAVIIRDDEEIENKAVAVTGLSEIVKIVYNALVASTDIPHTILFNESAGGLGSTGESERVGWYDYIGRLQNSIFRPRLLELLKIVSSSQESALYGKEAELGIEFNPLVQLTEKEQIELKKIQSEVDATYIDRVVVDPIEVRESRFSGGDYSFETKIDPAVSRKILEGIENNEESSFGPGLGPDPEGGHAEV